MSNVVTANGLQIGSNNRSLTFTELDGTVAEVFRDRNLMYDGSMILCKTLEPGAVAHTFPYWGGSAEDAEHHSRGQFIDSGTLTNGSVTISIDEPLIKALRVPGVDIENAKWDLVAPAVRETTRIVAEKFDKRAFRVLSLAARTSSLSGVHPGGQSVQVTAASIAAAFPITANGADAFADAAASLALQYDQDNVPETGRKLFISPYIRTVLTRSNRLMNRDYNHDQTNILNRQIGTLEGFEVYVTQHLPSGAITNDLSKYNGDWAVGGSGLGITAALASYMEAGKNPVGCVDRGGLQAKVWYDENRDVTLCKTRLATGLGVAHPWLGGEIAVHT